MSRSAHSGAAVASGTLPVERLERLWGWGRTSSATSYVYRPSTPEGVLQMFELARAHGVTVGLRGAGQSYGDAALNAGNICLDLSCMKRILAWDPGQGIIQVEPGVTIEQLWQHAIEDGWWPAVVPGTMFATLGGCLGMNVHGKNNWAVGPIGEHVVEFDLLLPNGEVRRCSREHEAELFHAAIGGFGMLGCFLSVTLRLKKVHSGLLDVEPFVARSLDEMIEVFEARMRTADHLVGWVDGLARGEQVGRGVVHQANHLGPGDDPEPARTLRVDSQTLPATLIGVVPASMAWRLMRPFMNQIGLRLINGVRYRWSRATGHRAYRQSHAAFAFLFDYIPNWNLVYGPGGMIQYQSFVPASRAARVFKMQLELARRNGLPALLGVLKRHRADPFLMSPAVDGYSLALEFKVTERNRRRLWALAAEFDALVLEAGGRLYFAKDSTTTAATVRRAYGEERIERFLALKRVCDPEDRLVTDLFRRLLCGRDEAL